MIFGIDENEIKINDEIRFLFNNRNISEIVLDDEAKMFSKTYRILENKVNKLKLESKEKLNEIIFFGHSLSNMDSSYFKSIFEYYSIYDSDIKLVFAYVNYDKNINVRQNYSSSINILIEGYSKITRKKCSK